MAASIEDLNALHSLIVKSLSSRIEQDIADNIPTDAATLGAAIKMLKDNAITADPQNKDDLTALRDKLKAESEARRKRNMDNVLSLVKEDMKAMEA